MDAAEYRRMAAHEDRHWWFVGRRAVLDAVLTALALPPGARILEIGCGTGGNLPLLARHGTVSAVETDDFARDLATTRSGIAVQAGALPDRLPAHGAPFDLVCLFDVLEHVADDAAALRALAPLLAPGGRLLLTVPAHRWLWGVHDERLHHRRRYARGELRARLEEAGFAMDRLGFFNAALLLPAMAARLLDRWGNRRSALGGGLPPVWLNRLLGALFAAEAPWLRRHTLPCGLSLLAVAHAGGA